MTQFTVQTQWNGALTNHTRTFLYAAIISLQRTKVGTWTLCFKMKATVHLQVSRAQPG